MKHIANIYKTAGLVACMGLFTTSCDLELLPLNEVVLENFWTDESDVENVLLSCYTAMQDGDWMDRAIIWGEIRSDNIVDGNDVPSYIQNINKGNLKQSNAACSWAAFYSVINRCNTVIYYAPQVAELDPNFTDSELASTLAEAKGLRAINYFYLIRTFKDVPFTFEPSIDDTQDYQLPASAHTDILDSLIEDIEGCKDDAPRRYTSETTSSDYAKNTGRITRPALYALLADMYLWRASDADLSQSEQKAYYQKCIEAANYVIEYKIDEYEEDADGTLTNAIDNNSYSLGYPLLAEYSTSGGSNDGPAATNAIFGTGNSWESLFEVTYDNSTGSETKNDELAYMYGGNYSSGSYQYVSASTELLSSELSSSDRTYSSSSLFSVCTDYRTLNSFHFSDGGVYGILKYTVMNFTDDNFGTATTSDWGEGSLSGTDRTYLQNYANWIIYRLSDVYLMRAEAEIEIGNMMGAEADDSDDADTTSVKRKASSTQPSSFSTGDEYWDDAFTLILAVYTRANPRASTNSTYYPGGVAYSGNISNRTITTYDDMIQLLEDERHREFLFEGKRYYDLVRRARREGSTSHYSEAVSTKYGDASRAVKIKMAQMDFMYMPIYEDELDANPNLTQNPAYAEDEETTLN